MQNNYDPSQPNPNARVLASSISNPGQNDKSRIVKWQVSGMVVTSILLGLYLQDIYDRGYSIYQNIVEPSVFRPPTSDYFIASARYLIFRSFYIYFYARVLFDRNYCSGRPELQKLWPLHVFFWMLTMQVIYTVISNFVEKLNVLGLLYTFKSYFYTNLLSNFYSFCYTIATFFVPVLWAWALYFGNDFDAKDSFRSWFKPWRNIEAAEDFPQQQQQYQHGGYGQFQGGYPQQTQNIYHGNNHPAPDNVNPQYHQQQQAQYYQQQQAQSYPQQYNPQGYPQYNPEIYPQQQNPQKSDSEN